MEIWTTVGDPKQQAYCEARYKCEVNKGGVVQNCPMVLFSFWWDGGNWCGYILDFWQWVSMMANHYLSFHACKEINMWRLIFKQLRECMKGCQMCSAFWRKGGRFLIMGSSIGILKLVWTYLLLVVVCIILALTWWSRWQRHWGWVEECPLVLMGSGWEIHQIWCNNKKNQ